MNAQPDRVRIFMVDSTAYEAVLNVAWEQFIHQLLTHGCVITNDALINRASIVRIMRFNPGVLVDTNQPGNIIDFPTKGSA